MREELIDLKFDMKVINKTGKLLRAEDSTGLHINVLEFVAIIINVWLALYFLRQDPDKVGGHIAAIWADNTSALSWLRHASRLCSCHC